MVQSAIRGPIGIGDHHNQHMFVFIASDVICSCLLKEKVKFSVFIQITAVRVQKKASSSQQLSEQLRFGQNEKIKPLQMAYSVRGQSSSSSHTFSSTTEWKYDVFLSFAGKDTRLKFVDHLNEAFNRSGIKTFRDDVDLVRGGDIKQELFQAIQDSLCAVPIISENYANSTWCLDELQEILESGRRVFPIFYDVDPADVRHQRNRFREALAEHEEKFNENTKKVQNWKNVLFEISNLAGWDTRGRHEAELIKDILEKVWTYLSSKLPSYDDNLVGIESRVSDMVTILEIGLDDKRIVGIWGMGGVGKTTLARVVYKKISYMFDVCCFLVNVRDTLQKEGLVSLQEKLLSDLKTKDMKINDQYEGKEMIRKHLSNKKVLLVLDDVDDTSQLENLAESSDWFGERSRILITTRNSHLLTAFGAQIMYDMKTMKIDESLQLFSKKAFREDYPKKDYLELSNSVVEYAGGLPLALKVLGSYFHGRSKAEWIDALNRMKQVHPHKTLAEKRSDSNFEKYIVLQESPNDVCKCSRLWEFKHIKEVLENKKGCGEIEAIVIGDEYWIRDKIEVHPEAFSKMSRLRLLLLNGPPNVSKGLKKLSGALKFVRWPSFPLEALPLPLDELVHIEMPHSNIKKLWNGIKSMNHLKIINLSRSSKLIETPDFSSVQSLGHLYLSRCASLVKVHESLGVLKELVEVDLHGCENLNSLPSKLETNSLRKLDLGGCKNVKKLPKFGEGMKKLLYLDASHTSITSLPESLGSLTGLRELNLSATSVINLPTDCFSSLSKLVFLSLSGCERLVSLPRLPPRLLRLEVDGGYSMKRKDQTPEWKYDVFLSFTGKDTGLNFTDPLCEAFSRSGIKCFRDDVDLQRGENINYLFQAIQDSLCAVLVISKNYAKSTWCLDELQKILESQNTLGRRVFPIFYNVNLADVRKQRESFGKALAELEEKFKENTTKVQNRRTALSKIGILSGWDTRDKHEADLIKNIVADVWSFLSTKLPSFDDKLVGTDSKVADVIPFLAIGLDDKRFVGYRAWAVWVKQLARVVSEKL
ncbi:hypothetical protein K1719_012081 [Acacia pycnantha]|nr:hypothetical protein K1719_012081 [Acacia pycnantha]